MDARLNDVTEVLVQLERWFGVSRPQGRELLALGQGRVIRKALDVLDGALRASLGRTLWTGQPGEHVTGQVGERLRQARVTRQVDGRTVFDLPDYKRVTAWAGGLGQVLGEIPGGDLVVGVLETTTTGLDPGGDAANEQGPGDPGSQVRPLGARLDDFVRSGFPPGVRVRDYRPVGGDFVGVMSNDLALIRDALAVAEDYGLRWRAGSSEGWEYFYEVRE